MRKKRGRKAAPKPRSGCSVCPWKCTGMPCVLPRALCPQEKKEAVQ